LNWCYFSDATLWPKHTPSFVELPFNFSIHSSATCFGIHVIPLGLNTRYTIPCWTTIMFVASKLISLLCHLSLFLSLFLALQVSLTRETKARSTHLTNRLQSEPDVWCVCNMVVLLEHPQVYITTESSIVCVCLTWPSCDNIFMHATLFCFPAQKTVQSSIHRVIGDEPCVGGYKVDFSIIFIFINININMGMCAVC
jgi:hypothetical protein